MSDLISRKATINTVINMRNRCDNDINDFYDLLIESFKVLPSEEQWTPVSEELPKENGKYLVSVKKSEWDGSTIHSVRTMTYNKMEVAPFKWGHYEIYSGKVIAWMPLPEPYRGDE